MSVVNRTIMKLIVFVNVNWIKNRARIQSIARHSSKCINLSMYALNRARARTQINCMLRWKCVCMAYARNIELFIINDLNQFKSAEGFWYEWMNVLQAHTLFSAKSSKLSGYFVVWTNETPSFVVWHSKRSKKKKNKNHTHSIQMAKKPENLCILLIVWKTENYMKLNIRQESYE